MIGKIFAKICVDPKFYYFFNSHTSLMYVKLIIKIGIISYNITVTNSLMYAIYIISPIIFTVY